jgi:non-ribosomal peptide synthetase component F
LCVGPELLSGSRQQLRTYTQTDGIETQPHATQTINERTSPEPDLVTAQSTAYAPPEDGLMGRPKHVRATQTKCFNKF